MNKISVKNKQNTTDRKLEMTKCDSTQVQKITQTWMISDRIVSLKHENNFSEAVIPIFASSLRRLV